MPHPVHGNRPTEIVILERAIVAKRILAEQTSILAKDEDPFVVDPRTHPRSLERQAPDDRHAISRAGPLLHNALFHDAPAPPKVCGCRCDRNAGSLRVSVAPAPLSHPALRLMRRLSPARPENGPSP